MMWYGEVTLLVTSLQSVASSGVGALPCQELYMHSRELWSSTDAYCKILLWWESTGASHGKCTRGKRARGCLGDTAFPGLGAQQEAARAEGHRSWVQVAKR